MSLFAKKNLFLLIMAVFLAIVPLVIIKDSEFMGADSTASNVITEINPDYEPWFESLWEPPSGEIETLLFCVQSAIGAGFIGYYFGYMRGKRKGAIDR